MLTNPKAGNRVDLLQCLEQAKNELHTPPPMSGTHHAVLDLALEDPAKQCSLSLGQLARLQYK